MPVPTDRAEKILVEVMQGKQPTIPDGPEEAAMRAQLTKECAEIQAQGYIVDVPHELHVNGDDAPAFSMKD